MHDFIFVSNKHIIKELSKRIIQQLDKCNKPNLEFSFPIYSVIVDFKNIGYIDVYSPLYDRNGLSKIVGFIVTRVELLKVKTIDEVFRLCTSQENPIFNLKRTTLFLYQNKENVVHRFIFTFSDLIFSYSEKIIQPSPNDRIFNILSPRSDRVYFGYQKENHYDQLEIYDYSSIDIVIIFLHSTEKFKNIHKITELLKENNKCNKLKIKHKNGKEYERL